METFVNVIEAKSNKKLLKYLESNGFEMSEPPHTLFSGRKKGLSVTLFASQKLVVQGKESKDFIEFFLEPEILKTFSSKESENYTSHIGVDESGKGDFFGPLVIAGVYADKADIPKLISLGVKDSKALLDKSIHKIAKEIKAHFPFQIVILNPKKYNEVYDSFKNLNSMLAWGHATVLEALHLKTGADAALIDQFANERVVLEALKRKKLKLNLTQRTKGESDPVVAAASILARDAFVVEMDKLSEKAGIKLPKGASAQVKAAAKKLKQEHGEEILPHFVKLHFKTLDSL